jgi:hypothetical protein
MRDIDNNKPECTVRFQVLFAYRFDQLESTLKSEYAKLYGINGSVLAKQGVYKKRPHE